MHIDNLLLDTIEICDSTQMALKELILQGRLSHGHAVLSQIQTHGKGRGGNVWVSNQGNLMMSLAVNVSDVDNIQQISYLSCMAFFQCLSVLLPEQSIKLKWPNDIYINGKKLAGFISENAQHNFLIIGIGCNVKSAPLPTSTALAKYGCEIQVEELAKLFLNKFKELYNHWLDFGFKFVQQFWMEHLMLLNQEILVRGVNNQVRKVIFNGIDLEGNLLAVENGLKVVINAGEVLFNC